MKAKQKSIVDYVPNGLLALVKKECMLKTLLLFVLFFVLLNLFVVCVSADLPKKKLTVTPQWQHKDTRMLCLEGCNLTGDHLWNRSHDYPKIMKRDDEIHEHEENYCGRACISMINSYYQESHAKKLSQDYISYHYFKNEPWKCGGTTYAADQPEGDLGHGKDISINNPYWNIRHLLKWALGGVEIKWSRSSKLTYPIIKEAIDAGHPILIARYEHALVIRGYEAIENIDGDLSVNIAVNDPLWSEGEQADMSYDMMLDAGTNKKDVTDDFLFRCQGWWFANKSVSDPLKDPENLSIDSDNDGIVDFDEEVRFETDVKNPDTDGDCLPDKLEIMRYTFIYDDATEKCVFDASDVKKPDTDSDGIRAEKDPDDTRYDIESCDDGGKKIKNKFAEGEKVYVKGIDIEDDREGNIYVFYDQTWKDGDTLVYAGHDCLAKIYDVEARSGNFVGSPIELGIVKNDVPEYGYFPYPKKYDIVYDRNKNNKYDEDVDLIDKVTCAGFETIPEFITIAIPSAIVFGLVFLISRRKRKE
jgi:hypothetical protein